MTAPQKSESPVAAGQVADQSTENGPIVAPSATTATDFAAAAEKFAVKGHALKSSVRADDGRVTFVVRRSGQSRSFTHWNDVRAFLAQIEEGDVNRLTYRQIAGRTRRISHYRDALSRATALGDTELAAAWDRAMARTERLSAQFVTRAVPSGGRS